MTNEQKKQYQDTEILRKLLHKMLDGKKFRLDCGHYITFGQFLGNDITIYNGKEYKIVCSQCGY